MKDTSGFDPLVEDIAILIDTAVADPARADDIKRQIMVRLALRTGSLSRLPETPAEADDTEDLWDNVPL